MSECDTHSAELSEGSGVRGQAHFLNITRELGIISENTATRPRRWTFSSIASSAKSLRMARASAGGTQSESERGGTRLSHLCCATLTVPAPHMLRLSHCPTLLLRHYYCSTTSRQRANTPRSAAGTRRPSRLAQSVGGSIRGRDRTWGAAGRDGCG